MKYRNTNITKMLEPEVLSPQKLPFRELKSYPVKDLSQNSVFPSLKISKFAGKDLPLTPEKDTEEKSSKMQRPDSFPIMQSQDSELKPQRKTSEEIDIKTLYADFKASYVNLSKSDKSKVFSILKQIMIESPTNKMIEIASSSIYI